MEQTDVQADSAPPRVSQRQRRPPAYLTDYEVSTLPLEGQTQTEQPAIASQCSHSGKIRSSQRSSSSRSTRASRSSIGRFPSHALSDLETAQLEERVKQMELEEFQQHLEEDQQVEYECQRLQAQAREAQQLQEEAIRTQESLSRQLERRRQLKKRVNELEIAKMVTSLLKEKAQEPSGSRVSPCPSENSNSSTHAALPSVGPVGQPPVPLVAPPSALTVAQPPAPVVAPPRVTMALHPLHTVPAGPRSTTFAPDISYQASTPFSVQPSQYARAACTNPAEAELSCTPTRTKSELHQLLTANAYPFLATGYGIPKPMIPSFESGRESDFALLKMALDNLLNSHPHLNEQYKYQVLLGHLRLPSAIQLAKAYMHDPTAMHALQDKYGQPRQLVQSELGIILNAPAIKFGDAEAFDAFALSIQSLVGMLRTLEGQNSFELRCGSHVDY
ncbi:actin cytoskeleton-regulatory complex protein PAN1-like [Haplochromis burtoni]|uniref:actin cytoskeleton-regulatory complex protein PAN1-like n=1 Tax=Haplochromis burtoni TaxID=8153 RepID=UPI001C2CD7FF|nr:actin cytoskeleton-regulatory complex protein PAN1-like [Haplochromis burtoni]